MAQKTGLETLDGVCWLIWKVMNVIRFQPWLQCYAFCTRSDNQVAENFFKKVKDQATKGGLRSIGSVLAEKKKLLEFHSAHEQPSNELEFKFQPAVGKVLSLVIGRMYTGSTLGLWRWPIHCKASQLKLCCLISCWRFVTRRHCHYIPSFCVVSIASSRIVSKGVHGRPLQN